METKSFSANYTTRILPREEWSRIDFDTSILDEEHTNIMVVELDGEIVGRWVLTPIYHAEGLWVKESFRNNPAVGRRLLKGMKAMANAVNAPFIVTMTQDEDVARLLDKLKNTQYLDGDFYAISFGD